MSKTTHTITLKSTESKRFVKRLALYAFSTLRYTTSSASKIPGVLSVVASDVRDAWRESANQKA